MRLVSLITLAFISLTLLSGCSSALSRGKTPDEVRLSSANANYVERDFADMHPDLP